MAHTLIYIGQESYRKHIGPTVYLYSISCAPSGLVEEGYSLEAANMASVAARASDSGTLYLAFGRLVIYCVPFLSYSLKSMRYIHLGPLDTLGRRRPSTFAISSLNGTPVLNSRSNTSVLVPHPFFLPFLRTQERYAKKNETEELRRAFEIMDRMKDGKVDADVRAQEGMGRCGFAPPCHWHGLAALEEKSAPPAALHRNYPLCSPSSATSARRTRSRT